MVPIVAIDVLPPAPIESPEVRAMVRACTAGLSRGRCALTDPRHPPPADDAPLAVAVVTWDSSGESALVELGKEEHERPRWLSQRLAFTERDAVIERWRAAGFAVAALAGELDPTLRASAPPEPEPEPEPGEPNAPSPDPPRAAPPRQPEKEAPPAPAPERPPAGAFWLAAGASAGPALDSGDWRVGPRLQAGFDWGDLPLFVALGGSVQFRPANARDLTMRWVTPNVTVGVQTMLGELDLTLRSGLEGFVAHVSAVAESSETGGLDSASRWTGGARWSGAAGWPARTSVFGQVDAGVSWSPSPTTIIIDGDRIGGTPRVAFDLGVAIGIRFR